MPPRPRIQVPTQIQGPGFRPSASPVDTFRLTNEGSGLRQLAAALSQVAPELARYGVQLDQARDEESARAAEEAAGEDLLKTKSAFEQARKERMIENHQDPIFRARYQELVGRHAGEQIAQNFSEWRAQNMPNATTLDEFDEGFDQYMDERLEDTVGDAIQNPAYRTAFQDTLRVRLLQERARFQAQAGARLSNLSDEEYLAEATASVRNDAVNGLSGEDIAARAAERLNVHLDFKAGGEDHPKAMARRYNEQTYEAMSEQVQTLAAAGDIDSAERVLAAMGALQVGTGLLRDTSYGSDIYLDTIARLEQADNVATARQARQNSAFITTTLAETRTEIRENGLRLEDIQPTLNQLDRMGTPEARQAADQLAQFATSWENAVHTSDPNLLSDLTPQMYDSGTSLEQKVAILDRHIGARNLAQGDYVQLRNIATQMAAASSSGGALTEEAYKQAERLFRDQFESGLLGNMTNEDAERLRRALPQFTAGWLAWRSQNPDASYAEQAAELERMGDSLLNSYAPSLSIDFGFSPPPPARWGLSRVITDDHWGAVNEAVESGNPAAMDPQGLQNLREAMQLAGIPLTPPATEEQRQQLLQQLGHLRDAQAPFIDGAVRQEPVPTPGPEQPDTVDVSGGQGMADEAQPDTAATAENRIAPIREELEGQDDASLVRELGDSIARFRELQDELGMFGGLHFQNVGKPSFSIQFDEEGIQERADLRDRIAAIQAVLQDRDVDISNMNRLISNEDQE